MECLCFQMSGRMNRCYLFFGLLPAFFLFACKTSQKGFRPNRRYSREVMRKDYMVFRHLLEAWHPSLYWYTSKDSMSAYFDEGYAAIQDSMTEPQFRRVLSYVIAKVDCGHTSVRASKAYVHYLDTARLPQFPLVLKFWTDTMVVAANLNRQDS